MQTVMLTLRADQMRPGDITTASRQTILRVVRDGLYKHDQDDQMMRGVPFPRGYVEVAVLTRSGQTRIDYWRAATRIQVDRVVPVQ